MRCGHLLTSALLLAAGAGLAPQVQAQTIHMPLRLELGISPGQLAIAARRQRLPASDKLECAALDTRLPRLVRTARTAPPELKPTARQDLQQARDRFDALRC